MGWDQSYIVESVEDALLRAAGISKADLVREALKTKGLSIIKEEEINLGDDYTTVRGSRVTLSDGRILEPRLVGQVVYDDEGTDYYEMRSPLEQIEVRRVYPEAESCGSCWDSCGGC